MKSDLGLYYKKSEAKRIAAEREKCQEYQRKNGGHHYMGCVCGALWDKPVKQEEK